MLNGNGNGAMPNSKLSQQQHFHLTKRILHLEQVNKTLMDELKKEREYSKEITRQVCFFFVSC